MHVICTVPDPGPDPGEVHRSESLSDRVMEHFSQPYVVCDAQGLVLQAGAGAYELLRRRSLLIEREAVGGREIRLVPGGLLDAARKAMDSEDLEVLPLRSGAETRIVTAQRLVRSSALKPEALLVFGAESLCGISLVQRVLHACGMPPKEAVTCSEATTRGGTVKEMARRLGKGTATINTQVRKGCARMSVGKLPELVRWVGALPRVLMRPGEMPTWRDRTTLNATRLDGGLRH